MQRIARRCPDLAARIVSAEPLYYREGADESEDRPAFVRAASGIAWLGERLAIVQDDANFIALRERDGAVHAVALPRGPGGRRRFEERLGNKRDKLDLEACLALDGALLAFGSGSLPVRETIAVMTFAGRPELRVQNAAPLYAAIRAALALAPDGLNLEAAALLGARVLLFNRGNGRTGVGSSSVEISQAELRAFLAGGTLPRAESPVSYDLGAAGTVPYGITDAAALPDGRVLLLAAAEDSADALGDGAVHGALVGVLSHDDFRITPLCDGAGHPARIKPEGIAPDPASPGEAWLVVDPDDPERPAELCRIHLSGL